MATIGDRDKHWVNIPDEYRPDILVYLGHVLHSYVDAGEKPPDYKETKDMLIQEGYKSELIAEQKAKIRSMLWQTHTLYEKPWGQGSLNFPGMTTRKAYGPNKQGPPKGGKRKRRKTKKGGDDDDAKKTKKNKDELVKRGKLKFQETEYYKNMKNEKNAHTDESLDVMKQYLKLEGLTESQAEKEVSSLPRSFQATEVHKEALSGGKRRRKTKRKKTLKKKNRKSKRRTRHRRRR